MDLDAPGGRHGIQRLYAALLSDGETLPCRIDHGRQIQLRQARLCQDVPDHLLGRGVQKGLIDGKSLQQHHRVLKNDLIGAGSSAVRFDDIAGEDLIEGAAIAQQNRGRLQAGKRNLRLEAVGEADLRPVHAGVSGRRDLDLNALLEGVAPGLSSDPRIEQF